MGILTEAKGEWRAKVTRFMGIGTFAKRQIDRGGCCFLDEIVLLSVIRIILILILCLEQKLREYIHQTETVTDCGNRKADDAVLLTKC